MPTQRIETAGAPAAVGPYSQAVTASGWMFCSGQIALDPVNGRMVGDGDVVAETRQVLKNLDEVLRAAGVDRSAVVKTTVYLVDMEDFSKMNEVYAAHFDQPVAPARACVAVASLPKGARVEIELIAGLPSEP